MFDPYHKWLSIPADRRPPTLYEILGVAPDEADAEVIENAAVRQTIYVHSFLSGPRAAYSTRLLNEIALARQTLLDPEARRRYDATLPSSSRPVETKELAASITTRSPLVVASTTERTDADSPVDCVVDRAAVERTNSGYRIPTIAALILLLLGGWLVVGYWQLRRIPAAVVAPDAKAAKVAPVAAAAAQNRPDAPEPAPAPPIAVVPEAPPPELPPPPVHEPRPPNVPVEHELGQVHVTTKVHRLLWSAHPRQVFVADDVVWLLNLNTGKSVRVFDDDVRGAAKPGMALSPDGQTLFTVREGHPVHAWNPVTGRQRTLPTARSAGPPLAVAPDGATLVFAREDGQLSLWDLKADKERGVLAPWNADRRPPLICVAIAPDCRRIFTGHRSGVFLWNAATTELLGTQTNYEAFDCGYLPTGVPVAAVPWSMMAYDDRCGTTKNLGNKYSRIQFIAGGKSLVACAGVSDKSLDVLRWPELDVVRHYQGNYSTFAVAPDQRSLVALDEGGTLRWLALP